MALDRPTFSESWYRVSQLTPHLLCAVKVHRQYFRGLRWYVLQDPASNQFFRLNKEAYHFIAMLDGRQRGKNKERLWVLKRLASHANHAAHEKEGEISLLF